MYLLEEEVVTEARSDISGISVNLYDKIITCIKYYLSISDIHIHVHVYQTSQ